ncbi:hypothetical protein WMY93_024959 [Mugilogobius chulae]|uniref:Uncharacterized protein n=1 Tax=Mugilogobius chulae TaxID=88201 RepID=A0AAW0N6M3_9GOBI
MLTKCIKWPVSVLAPSYSKHRAKRNESPKPLTLPPPRDPPPYRPPSQSDASSDQDQAKVSAAGLPPSSEPLDMVSLTNLSNWPRLGRFYKRDVTRPDVTSDEGGSPAAETVRDMLAYVVNNFVKKYESLAPSLSGPCEQLQRQEKALGEHINFSQEYKAWFEPLRSLHTAPKGPKEREREERKREREKRRKREESEGERERRKRERRKERKEEKKERIESRRRNRRREKRERGRAKGERERESERRGRREEREIERERESARRKRKEERNRKKEERKKRRQSSREKRELERKREKKRAE